jgi:hypothetical protein
VPHRAEGVPLTCHLYGYGTGVRSSRQIERRCQEDIAFRILAGNSTPDHVTIARFRVRHEHALAGLLVQSLQLCAAAGMVRLGLIALDGTKIEANAAAAANRTHAHLEAQVAELLSQAAEADQAEDGEHGTARGDELPHALVGRAERLARLQRAKAQLEAEAARQQRYYQGESRMLDSLEGICPGQAGSNIQLLPFPLVTAGRRAGRRRPGPWPATPGPHPPPPAR